MAKAFFEMPDGEKYEKPEKSPNYELFKDSLIFEDKAFGLLYFHLIKRNI